MPLEPAIRADLLRLRDELADQGGGKSLAEMHRYYSTFRARFGPETLRKLDGAGAYCNFGIS
jgi:hypothetical protein